MVGGKCIIAVLATFECSVIFWWRTHQSPLFICIQGIILYIMVTGFPPYDIPTTEDERYDIICQGGLMRQLRAWDSKSL